MSFSSPDCPILQLESVTRQFAPQGLPAVAGVSLSLQKGEILTLLGPSGCGKTTLLRLIAGFEAPQQGTVTIAQQVVASAQTWIPPEKRGVGMVFQDYALFPHLTVGQNITFGLTQKPAPAVAQRLQELVTLVGLEGLADRYPHQLSGGQQQRVALARALAPHPFLVLLDEPLSNLDVQVRLRLRQELRSILKAAQASAVFVTHDQEEALSISDRVAVMRQGQLEQIDSPESLYQQPTSRFVAEFVIQANILPVHRQTDGWDSELGRIAADRLIGPPALAQADRADMVLRPDDLTLIPLQSVESPAADSSAAIAPAVICDRQFLGRDYRYVVHLASGTELVVRTPITCQLPIGATVQVQIAVRSLQGFLPES